MSPYDLNDHTPARTAALQPERPAMNPHSELAPVTLSYNAALRGVRPRHPGEAFTYAMIDAEPELLTCLAASNPEGQFYGLLADAGACTDAEREARYRGVDNVHFIEGRPSDVAQKSGALPQLHYLCCDERKVSLPASERAALFALAEKILVPGGLFAYRYRAYASADGAMRFLVRELAPEMTASQAQEFLHELKLLGQLYLAGDKELAKKLDVAIAARLPDDFFALFGEGAGSSTSFDTLVALRPRGFAYVGDANISSNYLELAAPADTHQLIFECREHPFYEMIKDLVLNRQERSDVWCRQPAPASNDFSELFGNFTYGITRPRDEVPAQIVTRAKPVDLSAPLFEKLIDLLTLLPASIGDFLAHPDGEGFPARDVVGAVQILIACGIARPMRSNYKMPETALSVMQPRLVGGFNRHLDETQVTGEVLLASPVVGSAITVTARDALVMQALNRVGLADSVSALLPELQRLAQDPVTAARVMDVAEPTAEIAKHMVEDVVSQSIVQWYAYGILEAA